MQPQRSPRRGGVAPLIIVLLVIAAIAALSAVVYRSAGDGGGRASTERFEARRGNFDITIPCSGELAALRQIEIKNKLESRAVITFIIDEGKTVKEGDLLMQLADEELRTRIKDAIDAVKTAEAAAIAAQAKLEIQQSARDSDLAQASLDVELSALALQAWEEGEVVSMRQQLALALETAQINANRLIEKHAESARLLEEGFISKDEAEQDRIAMIEAEARLKQAQLDIQVYENYTFRQDEARVRSAVEQAQAERQRVEQRHEAELQTARADVESKRHQLESRRDRLEDLEIQLGYCTVKAPSDGLIVYGSSLDSDNWRDDDQPPQVGTELRSNETVMILPDTSRIVANVKVNEALSGLIQQGQRASVISDALPDAVINGEVLSVGVLAESGGWRDPNRRDYTVRVLLDGDNLQGLKPSMRCQAEIFVDRVEDALHVPVQAVFRRGRASVCYVPDGGGVRPQPVRLGRASELYVEVLEGLDDGEEVLLREPRAEEIVGVQQAEREGSGTGTDAGADAVTGADTDADTGAGPGADTGTDTGAGADTASSARS